MGHEALFLLHAGRAPEAAALLNWKREQTQFPETDDPLTGSLFARFWTAGASKGTEAIQTASVALLSGSPEAPALLPAVLAARDKAASRQERTSLTLLLANMYLQAGDGPGAARASAELLKLFPDSLTAIHLTGQADGLLKEWPAWNALLDSRLAKHPAELALLEEKALAAETEENFPRARMTLRTLLDSGRALDGDYNNYAWLALFDGTADRQAIQQAVDAAQQAAMLGKVQSFSKLHTLACLYAIQGRTTDARQLLLEAMSSAELSTPDSATWLGFGLIYEQYGVPDAAIAAYKNVKAPPARTAPLDSYVLAQRRLKALHAN